MVPSHIPFVPSPLHICLYTSTALPKLGGQEAVVDQLARQFVAMGHKVVVLAPMPRLPMWPRDRELPYPVCRHPRFYSTKWFVRLYQLWLRRLHARERFDIIHCHDVYPTGYVAALSKAALGTPLVITSHGGDVKAGNIRISKPGMKPRYQQAIRAADALVSIGRFTTEGFLALAPEAGPIEAIPNGIDLAPYQQRIDRPPALPAEVRAGQYFLFLGRLKHRKGVDLLLEALARLTPTNAGVELIIAGTGEEEAALRGMCHRLQLESRVHFAGRVDGQLKLWLLQNARATVMPSRVWEAFPLVILESYAAGRPMIGTRIAGIEDLIWPGRTGTLVEPESAPALAEAMQQFRADAAEADRLGQAAREVAGNYSWSSVACRHVELYERLLGNKRIGLRDARAVATPIAKPAP